MLIFWLLKYKKIIYIKHNEEIQSYFYYISSILSAVCLIAAPSIPERAWFISAVYGVTSAGIFFANLDKPAEEKRAGVIKDISFIITVCGCIFCVVSIAEYIHKPDLNNTAGIAWGLCTKALDAGGRDNITCIIAKIIKKNSRFT